MNEEKLKEIVMSFDNWVWCNCGECRIDCNSHAVDTEASKAALVKYIIEELKK